MPWIGSGDLTQTVPEPFFLLDESLSSGIVEEASRITGHAIATVWEEWQGRDSSVSPLLDQEIVRHLGDKAGHRAVWITGDRRALGEHGHLIDDHRISVIWLRGPGRRPLEPREQLRMLCAVLDKVSSLIGQSSVPVYLRVRLDPNDGYQPYLEKLQGTVLDRPLEWQRIPQN